MNPIRSPLPPLHLPTLALLVALQGVLLLAIWATPHRTEGLGRMNLHQAYGTFGRIASLGLIKRTLVDWYMRGPTLEENRPFYDRYVLLSVVQLTPIFTAWSLLLSAIVSAWRRRSLPASDRRPWVFCFTTTHLLLAVAALAAYAKVYLALVTSGSP